MSISKDMKKSIADMRMAAAMEGENKVGSLLYATAAETMQLSEEELVKTILAARRQMQELN